VGGLISFYKQFYLHIKIMLTTSNAKAIIKDNAWKNNKGATHVCGQRL
jgi:hypothetical protein